MTTNSSRTISTEYRFRSFDEEQCGETILMSLLVLIDENRAASAAIAVGLFCVTAFFFGYGAGGVVDATLHALLP